MVSRVKGEDWRARAASVLYATPDTSAVVVASAIPTGTVIRTIGEAPGTKDGGSWRLTEWQGKVAWFRYRTAAGVLGTWEPTVQNGDPAVDAGLDDYLARKWPAITTPPPVQPPTTEPPPVTEPPPASTVPPAKTPVTLFDDFSGTALNARWQRHFHCCGVIANPGGFDPSLSKVANGMLAMSVERRADGWHGDLIDTKTTFLQRFGIFEARIKIPKGKGLWPAWWLYAEASGWYNEIDVMEICANPMGANGGNDASLLHATVHWAGGGQSGKQVRAADLSADFHIYGCEWRAGGIVFTLDGAEVWRYTDTTHIPTNPLPLILNLGVGGSWCSNPDASTPSPATMLVDWVRVCQ